MPLEEEIRKFVLANAVEHNGKADVNAILGKILGTYAEYRQKAPELMKRIKLIVDEINKLPFEEQKKLLALFGIQHEKKPEKRQLLDLPDAKIGKVITAYPPEPSKYPHIGHAYSILINYLHAEKYKGRFILRFEDTNPKLAKDEFYKAQLDGYTWLGIKPSKIIYASDYLLRLYEAAERLIKSNNAYCCTCKSEDIRKNRHLGKQCPCEKNTAEQSLKLWGGILNNKYKEGEVTLRIKINMKDKNSAMRNPSIMRIIAEEHPRTKRKYVVWPTYVFQTALLDSWTGITHRFRSKEFEVWTPVQQHIQDLLKLKKPWIYHYARVNLKSKIPSSGRKIRELISKKKLRGWDDPRLTTLTALKKRGIQPEAIKNFVLDIGMSKTESTADWTILYGENKKVVDAIAKRFFFVYNPVEYKIELPSDTRIAKVPVHPEKHELGFREFKVKNKIIISKSDAPALKKEFRLKGLCNVMLTNNVLKFTSKEVKKDISIIHWLPADKDATLKVKIIMDNGSGINGLAEKSISTLKAGDIIQFERFGFCRLDKKEPYVFYFAHK